MAGRGVWRLAAAAVAACLLASCGRGKWFTSFEAAQQDAARRERPILMVVLDGREEGAAFRAAMDGEDFLSTVGASYTLLRADASGGDAEEGGGQPNRWAALAETDYYIGSAPSIFVVSEEGYVLAYVPFEENFAEVAPLASVLAALRGQVAAMRAMISDVHFSSGTEQVQAIGRLYDATDERFRAPLLDLCRQALALDPANHAGLAGKFELALAYADCAALLRQKDAEAARAVFPAVAQDGHLDKAQLSEAYTQAAFVYALTQSADYGSMRSFLDRAFEADPANANAAQVNQLRRLTQAMGDLYAASGMAAGGNSDALPPAVPDRREPEGAAE